MTERRASIGMENGLRFLKNDKESFKSADGCSKSATAGGRLLSGLGVNSRSVVLAWSKSQSRELKR